MTPEEIEKRNEANEARLQATRSRLEESDNLVYNRTSDPKTGVYLTLGAIAASVGVAIFLFWN